MKQFGILALVCATGMLMAGDGKWTARQLLTDSPWAKQASAFFGTTDEDARDFPVQSPTPRDAGMGGRSVSDGRWDGGVGRLPRGGTPSLPVTVRWDSALPVRQALLESHAPELRDSDRTIAQPEKYYIITVIGLARGQQAVRMDAESPGDPDISHRTPFDMSQTRQGLMNYSRLMPKGKKSIVPEDVRVNEVTGSIQLFFPKSDPISLSDKEVTFGTTFGSIKVTQKFKLKDMNYQGKLEL